MSHRSVSRGWKEEQTAGNRRRETGARWLSLCFKRALYHVSKMGWGINIFKTLISLQAAFSTNALHRILKVKHIHTQSFSIQLQSLHSCKVECKEKNHTGKA